MEGTAFFMDDASGLEALGTLQLPESGGGNAFAGPKAGRELTRVFELQAIGNLEDGQLGGGK